MDSIDFSPLQDFSWNALLLFGTLLICGLIGGQIVAKIRWLPRITGYLLIGFALGSDGLGWVSGELFDIMHIFADVAIALIVYQLGRYVDLGWLLRERWLIVTIALSSALSFILVWGLLEWSGVARGTAMLAGIFSIGTSPAVVIAVMRDTKAEGHLARRLAAMSALNNVIALLVAYCVLPFLASGEVQPIQNLALHAVYTVAGSLFLAYVAYRLMMPLARWLGRRRQQQFVLIIAIITLTLGCAHALKLPPFLTMLAFAILSRNLDRRYDLMDVEFGVVTEMFIVLLFVTLGTTTHIPRIPLIAMSAILLIFARYAAVGGSIFAFAKPAKMSWKQAALLSVGSLPITESGLGLIQLSAMYPHTTADIVPILAGVLMVSELLGPIATQFALTRTGDGNPA
jgi:Kef-type K+ transport system membrane component KefB